MLAPTELTWNAIDVLAAAAGHEYAVDATVDNLWLLQQLPLGILTAVEQHDSLLGSDSEAVGASTVRRKALLVRC